MPINVIFADDHVMFRQGLAPLLEAAHELELLASASNGREAWELIETLRPNVAILDISMPEMTGIEVARKTGDAGIDTQVIILTMHAHPSVATEAQKAGAAGYVLKDNSFEELVLAVQTVAAGGTFITPAIRNKLRKLQRNGRTTVTLSPREREVIRFIALGNSSKEVARIMKISPRTVDTYRYRVSEKLQLQSLADLVRYAVRAGIVV